MMMKPIRIIENMQEGRSSETYSEDDEEEDKKSSYDCTFCRRGFTNAQALGGHMNIHRKHKANNNRPKNTSIINYPPSSSSSPPNKFQESMASSTNSSSSTTCYYPFFDSNHQSHPPTPPPAAYEFMNTRRYHHDESQELLGPNLSLQIGSPSTHQHADQVIRTRGIINHQNKDAQVLDLELRL
ncbi:hypothetical protein PIB30_060582 [Stylosanthes scabra]|uniref:C2H2-type domain-containing protein n=1 Tax=Stylosanthes scabra TaxID=79078 RepID=A0ABU6YKX6_9FABA|nr:hypothetical protein [Stylosanthes scabra]